MLVKLTRLVSMTGKKDQLRLVCVVNPHHVVDIKNMGQGHTVLKTVNGDEYTILETAQEAREICNAGLSA